jgi:hypothetical protein
MAALLAAAAVSLTVNTTVLTDKAWVAVTYSGLPEPRSSVFFGARAAVWRLRTQTLTH